MDKDRKKNLVGQPIFKQIIKMLPRDRVGNGICNDRNIPGAHSRRKVHCKRQGKVLDFYLLNNTLVACQFF